MKTIKNLKIRQKLYVLIGIAVFGLLSVQSMSLFQMRNLISKPYNCRKLASQSEYCTEYEYDNVKYTIE